MTNGEKLQSIFPNMEWEVKDNTVLTDIDNGSWFSLDWWNAEYKESTTQERQAESDKFDAAFQDGYDNGYAQARFDYEQEPKIGHWISHREHCENLGVMPSGLGAYEWCSNCDCGIDVREWHRNNYNYCPNCGVKMVEPQESENP